MRLKFVTGNDIVLQLLEDFVPRPSTGAAPLNPAGGLPSSRPPRLCSSNLSLETPAVTKIQPQNNDVTGLQWSRPYSCMATPVPRVHGGP